MASFTVSKRTKEIGIRKVLGASGTQLMLLLSKDFVIMVLISAVISFPITYLLVESWLDTYAFRIGISFWYFIAPTFLVVGVAFFTVLSQTFKVSNADPVKSLRDE